MAEAADAPVGLVEKDIGYGCALMEAMSEWALNAHGA